MHTALRATGASFVAGPMDNNPRDLIISLVKDHPNWTRSELFDEFRKAIQSGGDSYQRAVDWYFFVNMHGLIRDSRPTNEHVRKQPDAAVRAVNEQRIQTAVENIRQQIVFLDLTMPNGKTMKDCTGAEMAKFGNRYQKIAEKVGKAKTVGAVLSEEQVRGIMR